jgi:rhodanese-related sulfurtransferase
MKNHMLVVVALAATLLGCSGLTNDRTQVPSVAPAQAVRFLEKDTSVVFLDVRSRAEYTSETGHVRGATLIPVDSLQARIRELEPQKSKTFVVYCRTGGRSARAQKILTEQGFRALNMLGGITRWNKEQLPVVKE